MKFFKTSLRNQTIDVPHEAGRVPNRRNWIMRFAVASILLVLGTLIRFLGPRDKAGEARNKRWLLPLWALLHGLPVNPTSTGPDR